MARYRSRSPQIDVGKFSISPTMANALLDLKHGVAPYWPNRTVLALQKRHLAYPEADRGGRFMLSDLGLEIANILQERYGRRV